MAPDEEHHALGSRNIRRGGPPHRRAAPHPQALATFGPDDRLLPAHRARLRRGDAQRRGDGRPPGPGDGRAAADRHALTTCSTSSTASSTARNMPATCSKNTARSAPGLMYSYRNELQETNIVSERSEQVAGRLKDDLDARRRAPRRHRPGRRPSRDISLMKFIYELTACSLGHNLAELGQRGLLGSERGLPRAARARLEEMFAAVQRRAGPARTQKPSSTAGASGKSTRTGFSGCSGRGRRRGLARAPVWRARLE